MPQIWAFRDKAVQNPPVRTSGCKSYCRCDNLLNMQTLSHAVRSKGQVQSMGSVLQLSKLVRMESGAWRGRKAIPHTVRIEYQRLYGPACEANFWRPAGTTAQQAKAEFAEWLALIEHRITVRQEASCGRAIDLTQDNKRPMRW
jgi:hypothetical protein